MNDLGDLEALMLEIYNSSSSSHFMVFDQRTHTAAYLAHRPVDDRAQHELIQGMLAFLKSRLLEVGSNNTFFLNSPTDEAICHVSDDFLVFFIYKGHEFSKADVLRFVDRILSALSGFNINEGDFKKKTPVRLLKIKSGDESSDAPVKKLKTTRYPKPLTPPPFSRKKSTKPLW